MNQNESYEFTKIYDELLPVQSLKVFDGSVVNLSLTTKVIWCYMYRKYDFYGRLGNDFYENRIDMANNLGIDLSTFKRSLKILTDAGAIKISKTKLNGFIRSNKYEVKHPVRFCTRRETT